MHKAPPTPPVPRPGMLIADAHIAALSADLAQLAGTTTQTWPRRFYNAAASALNRVRRAYAEEMCDDEPAPPATVPGEAEDQGGAS